MSNNSEAFNSNLFEISTAKFDTLTVFRNNCGCLWDATGRPVYYGVAGPTPRHQETMGGSDFIGWQSVTVTPEMVGQQLAVFCAFELKADDKETEPKRIAKQENFIAQVNAAGGFAGFVRRPIDISLILTRQGCVKLSEYPRERLG